MRELEMTGKTVEEALEAACEQLGVDRDDLNVSYEVLEFPAKRLFKSIPARVKVTVAGEEAKPTAPAVEETTAAPVQAEAPAAPAAAPKEAPVAAETTPAPTAEVEEIPLDVESDERLKAAVEYLQPIFSLMGAENVSISAVQKGEATILKVDGEHVGALIGRRGETMESLSYLASLVVNRMEGPYKKLGLDVGGYRNKREEDLGGLTARLCDRVRRTGYCYEMEPMNPYERHIIHAAVSEQEGVRSESKGEGPDRRVVIYSTDPNASNEVDRESSGLRRGARGGHGRGGDRRGGPHGRFGSRDHSDRGGYGRGGAEGRRSFGDRGPRPQRSNVPPREFADAPREDTAPVAPTRTEHAPSSDDFALFGKIDL